MYLSEGTKDLREAWDGIINHPDLPKIDSIYRRDVTIRLLENQEEQSQKDGVSLREAAPTNATGAAIDNWDPILVSLVRRSVPNLIAFDIAGVQPMTGPTGLIFAIKSRYTDQNGTEALGLDEPDSDFSGTGTHSANVDPFDPNFSHGGAMPTAASEALGDGVGPDFAEMAFSIEKTSVTAKTRALKAEYTLELAQDLKAVHGLDAEQELANILSTEILGEINREVVRLIYNVAKKGAQKDTAVPGEFNLDIDSNGRWSVEKFKGLMFQIERDANAIARDTRRGRGNIIICSSDVASALAMSGKLDINNALQNNLTVDDTGNTFVGILNGRYKVYIDPYWNVNSHEFYVVGYKGATAYDAGIFYTPYVPLQMVRAIGEKDFQPRIGFKTRYGLVANPYTNQDLTVADVNPYYRKVKVTNLM